MDIWPHPLSRPEPPSEPYLPLSSDLVELTGSQPTPFLVYDLHQYRQSVSSFQKAFDQYLHPVKTNPNTKLLQTCLHLGGGLDVCSPAEFELALAMGARGKQISYTGLSFSPSFFQRLASSDVRVDLDSWEQACCWTDTNPGKPVGLRIAIDRNRGTYGYKFGITPERIQDILSLLDKHSCILQGIHVHTWNEADSPAEFVHCYDELWQILLSQDIKLEQLQYLNLGGGWAYNYSKGSGLDPQAVWQELVHGPIAVLRQNKFTGEVVVEPGERVISSCGYWVTTVVTMKQNIDGQKVIIVDSPTPIPSAAIPYPISILRDNDGTFCQISAPATEQVTIHGCTNSPFDLIRKSAWLPRVRLGDKLIFHRTGAYLPVLTGRFNGFSSLNEICIKDQEVAVSPGP